jgi:hypothetical protein
LCACLATPDSHVDGPTILTFGGREYFSSLPASLSVPEASAHRIGVPAAVENRPPTLIGDAVYSLDGIDPTNIVVMKSTEAGRPILLFIATDFLTGSPPDELARKVPAICIYVPAEAGCP